MRKTGILLHISSLPSNYGIGTFGKEAYRFVDFLYEVKQTYWQILPLGPTSYGDSPYQTFSSVALNPYFIDLDFLVKEGLLKHHQIIDSTTNWRKIDYGRLYQERFKTLKYAFENFNQDDYEYQVFLHQNHNWVFDYALFMSIKKTQDDRPWSEWPDHYKLKDEKTIESFKKSHLNDINFNLFLQFKAYEQWMKLKKYANDKGIQIIGDLPIYVAYDSSDVWTQPKYFLLDDQKQPISVAGVPPDNYSKDGQLWGNPLYDWNYMEKNGYRWWINRVKTNITLFDWVRIDHFIGFVHYFAIPFADKTAHNGVWKDGPKHKLFDAIKRELGELNIIAEDLGMVTQEVRDLLAYTNFPGMKLLQFAFDSREDSSYLPHHYTKNSVAYTGTHDNDTTKGWFESLSPESLEMAHAYINHQTGSQVYSLIKATLASVSDTAIIPLQDYLECGSEGRMNTPSTLGNNWVWRFSGFDLTPILKEKIRHLAELYGRAP